MGLCGLVDVILFKNNKKKNIKKKKTFKFSLWEAYNTQEMPDDINKLFNNNYSVSRNMVYKIFKKYNLNNL